MKRFVCYIGCAALVFKLMYGAAWAAGATAGDTAAPENGGAAVSAAAAVAAVRETLPVSAAAAVSAVRDTLPGTAAAVGGESIVYRVRDLTAAASGGDIGSGDAGGGDTGSEGETPEPIIRSDNELAKLALLPFNVDKVFAGGACRRFDRVFEPGISDGGRRNAENAGKRNPLFRQLEAQIRLCGGTAET